VGTIPRGWVAFPTRSTGSERSVPCVVPPPDGLLEYFLRNRGHRHSLRDELNDPEESEFAERDFQSELGVGCPRVGRYVLYVAEGRNSSRFRMDVTMCGGTGVAFTAEVDAPGVASAKPESGALVAATVE